MIRRVLNWLKWAFTPNWNGDPVALTFMGSVNVSPKSAAAIEAAATQSKENINDRS